MQASYEKVIYWLSDISIIIQKPQYGRRLNAFGRIFMSIFVFYAFFLNSISLCSHLLHFLSKQLLLIRATFADNYSFTS